MKFKLCPFRIGDIYVLETAHDDTGDIRYFIGEWNGFSFSTDTDEDGIDMLACREISGYICLTGEDAE